MCADFNDITVKVSGKVIGKLENLTETSKRTQRVWSMMACAHCGKVYKRRKYLWLHEATCPQKSSK